MPTWGCASRWRRPCETSNERSNCSSSGRWPRSITSRSASGSQRMRNAECGMRSSSTLAVPEIAEFVEFLTKERNDSPHTVKAYARDVAEFAAFCGRYYGGPWSWAGVDRLAIRGFLGRPEARGLARRSVARGLSALRTVYRLLNLTKGGPVNPPKSARTPKLARPPPACLHPA